MPGDYSYRAISEISEAVERGMSESGLAKLASDDGASRFLSGVKKYVTLVITSFVTDEKNFDLFGGRLAVLSEVDPSRHMNALVTSITTGDIALMLGVAREGSPEKLSAMASVAYGTTASLLRMRGHEHRTFGYMSVRAQPLIESMGVVGVELALRPKAHGFGGFPGLKPYIGGSFSQS